VYYTIETILMADTIPLPRRTDPSYVENLFFNAYSKPHSQTGFGIVQFGGNIPVFEGGPYFRQRGEGFSSFLGSAARKLLPVFLKTGLTAAGAFLQSRESGKTVKESLFDSVRPAAGEAIRSGIEEIERYKAKQGQDGKGRRKKRKKFIKTVKLTNKIGRVYKRSKKHEKMVSRFRKGNHLTHFNF
jgi:hypothetical protein